MGPRRVRRVRRHRELAALLGCLILLLAGCAAPADAPAAGTLTTVRVALYPSAATLPARAALTERMFARHGLQLEVTEGQDLPLFLASLAKGDYDIAMSGPTLMLIGADKGLDLQVVSSMQQSTRDRPNAVWITADPALTDVAQLRGGTVAVPALTGIIIDSLVYLLQRAGIAHDQITFVQTPFSAMADQLAAGRVTAAVATLPFSASIAARGFHLHDDVIVEAVQAASGGAVATAMTSVWAAAGPFVRAHPDAIRGFRAALSDGIDFLDADPARARTLMRDWLKMPAAVADRAPLPQWGVPVTAQQLAPYLAIAKGVGAVRGDPDVTTLVWQGP